MKTDLLSGLEAAAYGARLAKVDMVPDFPMPGISRITDKIRGFCQVFDVDSQGSVLTAAMGATACEKRSFFAVNSINALQDFLNASLMRLPLVAAGMPNPVLRDIGWILFMPSSNQEIFDTVVQAYRICEDNNVLLPGFVSIGLPELREPVILPTEQSIRGFLPRLRLQSKIDAKKPMAIDIPGDNLELRLQQHKAMENAVKIIQKTYDVWKKKFRRSYSLVESYCMEDAETAVVAAGPECLTAKVAVNRLREQGDKVGLLRLRVIRPLPSEEIKNHLKNVKHVAVVENSASPGSSGILYKDVKECYSGLCSSFLSSRLNEDDFINIFKQIKNLNMPERFWML